MADFGKGDLASVFGVEANDQAVKLKNDKRDEVPGFQPKLDPARKTVRYRAGEVPAFMATSAPQASQSGSVEQANSAGQASAAAVEAAAVEEYHSDSDAIESYNSDAESVPRCAPASAAPVAGDSSDSDSDAEAAALAAARARARARANAAAADTFNATSDASLVEQALQQPAAAPSVRMVHTAPEADSDSDASVHRPAQQGAPHRGTNETSSSQSGSSSGSESSSDDEEEADDWLMAARPVFVPAAARTTIKTQEQLDAEAAKEATDAEKQRAARREAAQEAVATVVLAEEEAAAAGSDEEDMPSDGDHSSEEEADFSAWKLRELKRQQRDLAAAAAVQAETESTLARRAMTDAERAADDKRLEAAGVKVFTKAKRSRGFMQKHYHKGVFYMDEDSVKDKDDVRRRVDADAATGADRVDKKILPKAMQVRDFGKRGQSKWTHLAAEDTTFAAQAGYTANAVSSDLSAAPKKDDSAARGAAGMWFKGGSSVVNNVVSRMAGAGSDINDAGRVRRRDTHAAHKDSSRHGSSDQHQHPASAYGGWQRSDERGGRRDERGGGRDERGGRRDERYDSRSSRSRDGYDDHRHGGNRHSSRSYSDRDSGHGRAQGAGGYSQAQREGSRRSRSPQHEHIQRSDRHEGSSTSGGARNSRWRARQ